MPTPLITPADIRSKALKLWDSGRLLQDVLSEGDLFPLDISFRKPSASQLAQDFAAVRVWLQALRAQSQEAKKHAYQIEWRAVEHRRLGAQSLPQRICFLQREDLLGFIGKQQAFAQLMTSAQQTLEIQPALADWLQKHPQKFMQQQAVWPQLLAVCAYFQAQPRPNCYVRELDISGVDSKFIEQHKGILSELLDQVLPSSAIAEQQRGLRNYGFEKRYGLRYEEPLIRLRLLDERLSPLAGVTDFTLPVSQLAHWPIACERVFITENKINGLSFPAVENAIVIFGLGYGVDSLAALPWLRERAIDYWGDIDTHGLAILSRLRQYFPQTRSLLMDAKTLATFAHLCSTEADSARADVNLLHLTAEEAALYAQLQQSQQRLEQERVPLSYLKSSLPPNLEAPAASIHNRAS